MSGLGYMGQSLIHYLPTGQIAIPRGSYQRYHDYVNGYKPPPPIPKWKRLTKGQRMDERLDRRRKAIRDKWTTRGLWALSIAAGMPVLLAGLALLWKAAFWAML